MASFGFSSGFLSVFSCGTSGFEIESPWPRSELLISVIDFGRDPDMGMGSTSSSSTFKGHKLKVIRSYR